MTREEAIEVYKGLINTKIKEAFEFFAPELRESEDERIRKALVNEISGWSDVYKMFKYAPKEKVLAWFEKQKEQKPLSTEETELNSIAFLEQLGYTCIPPGTKQEWTEEDKDNLNNIIWLCENCEKGIETTWTPSQATQIKNLIKSLLERFNLQPKQEWSEENEDKLYQIIETLLADKEIACRDNPQHYDVLCKAYDEQIAWLKSLCPSWKPSEEQMQYLLAVINDPNNAGAESCHLILESLYNDLKEL